VAGGSIELCGLTKRFGEIALDNVDLAVASGEFFSLLGPAESACESMHKALPRKRGCICK
jgi:ABC-type multidrug transport system ATPase subunit